MILVADIRKVSAKSHDELLDVADNGLFYNLFVYILGGVNLHFLHIDIIKQILS